MIKAFFTKEQHWLDQWDNFLQNSERGLYNQLSDWIKAYQVYGFDYVFYIIVKDETVIGGCGIVIAKFGFFKFLCVPSGPVINENHEDKIELCLDDILNYAKKINCCYFQINIPFVKEGGNFHNYSIHSLPENSSFYSGAIGTKFKYVIPLYGMRLIDLTSKNLDEVIQKFGSNHKRNLKKAEHYDFQFKFVSTEAEIAIAYDCFVKNALQKNYPLRSYESMKETLLEYLAKDFAKIGVCLYQDKIVGAIYVMVCGRRLTYINGGVVQEFQELPISFFMHHQIMKFAIGKEYKSYDISVGGSAGVVRFKEGFGSQLYLYENTRHWILKPFYFSIYSVVEKRLKNHKQAIAKVLVFFKKIFKNRK